MSAQILDGRAMAQEVKKDLTCLIKRYSLIPGLAIVQVGNNPASDVYVRQKVKACEEVGIHCDVYRFAEDVDEMFLVQSIKKLNEDPSVHGIIVQLPLPETVSEMLIQAAVALDKDVDGLHPMNGAHSLLSRHFRCTPKAVMRLIEKAYGWRAFDDLNATVIGRSDLVGMPTAEQLINQNATVTVCHSKTKDLAEHTRSADILVVAAGHPKLITADMVKPGAIVIDVGINRADGKLCGDVDFEGVKEVAGWITPVPGGVGPMTVAMLLDNTVTACLRASGK